MAWTQKCCNAMLLEALRCCMHSDAVPCQTLSRCGSAGEAERKRGHPDMHSQDSLFCNSESLVRSARYSESYMDVPWPKVAPAAAAVVVVVWWCCCLLLPLLLLLVLVVVGGGVTGGPGGAAGGAGGGGGGAAAAASVAAVVAAGAGGCWWWWSWWWWWWWW